MRRRFIFLPAFMLASFATQGFSHGQDHAISLDVDEEIRACHYFLNELIDPLYDSMLLITFRTVPKKTLGLDRYLKLSWPSVSISTSKVELLGTSEGKDRLLNAAVECMVDIEARKVLRLRFSRGWEVGDAIDGEETRTIGEFVYSDEEMHEKSHQGRY